MLRTREPQRLSPRGLVNCARDLWIDHSRVVLAVESGRRITRGSVIPFFSRRWRHLANFRARFLSRVRCPRYLRSLFEKIFETKRRSIQFICYNENRTFLNVRWKLSNETKTCYLRAGVQFLLGNFGEDHGSFQLETSLIQLIYYDENYFVCTWFSCIYDENSYEIFRYLVVLKNCGSFDRNQIERWISFRIRFFYYNRLIYYNKNPFIYTIFIYLW